MSNIPNSPEDRKAIRAACEQISEELTTIQTSKSQIKELEDKYKMPKRTLKKVALLYHKQTAVEFENETAEIKSIYKSITS